MFDGCGYVVEGYNSVMKDFFKRIIGYKSSIFGRIRETVVGYVLHNELYDCTFCH